MNPQELFKVKNGSFSYGASSVLQNLSFKLRKGKFYGLIGPNGSGKSTLIDLLMGIRELGSGELVFCGKPINRYRRRDLARHLALVPQNINVGFDFSVHAIVLMGRHPHIPRFSQPSHQDLELVEKTLVLLDIHHLRERSITNLSGGERQRVIVARALAQDTDVLMLDEATSNLDIQHTIDIMRVLRNRVEQTELTVVAAIHDLNLAAAFCDELLVLKNKTLHLSGPVRSILTADLVKEVFSVEATIDNHDGYPRIAFDMLPG